mmetsp:Transcript_35600/g.100077  ORF Transcript_35600/g.100077 Transcript_35600/m.100077 type:complete len:216 (-) Transcript_35600:222-869(-)
MASLSVTILFMASMPVTTLFTASLSGYLNTLESRPSYAPLPGLRILRMVACCSWISRIRPSSLFTGLLSACNAAASVVLCFSSFCSFAIALFILAFSLPIAISSGFVTAALKVSMILDIEAFKASSWTATARRSLFTSLIFATRFLSLSTSFHLSALVSLAKYSGSMDGTNVLPTGSSGFTSSGAGNANGFLPLHSLRSFRGLVTAEKMREPSWP